MKLKNIDNLIFLLNNQKFIKSPKHTHLIIVLVYNLLKYSKIGIAASKNFPEENDLEMAVFQLHPISIKLLCNIFSSKLIDHTTRLFDQISYIVLTLSL